MEPNPKYGNVASEDVLNKVVAALKKNGIDAVRVKDGSAARTHVLQLIPKGSQLMTMTSMTLEALGLPDVLNGKDYESVRDKFPDADERTKRQLGAAPDWVVGSCHAITEDGQIVMASATGSQIPAHAYGAKNVVLVVGGQKIVKDLDDALKRVHEYSFPLEDVRALKAYGMHSGVNKILIISKEVQKGRMHVVLIEEKLGY